MKEITPEELQREAIDYADSQERGGCSSWAGMKRGYEAAIKAVLANPERYFGQKVGEAEIINNLRYEFMFQFRSEDHWVSKGQSWFRPYKGLEYICLDTNGNLLTCGLDFMVAEKNNLYPVKVYRLIRTSEAKEGKVNDTIENK